MKAVIITANGPEHRFVTRKLVESLGEHLCGVVIERGAKEKSFMKSFKSAARRYGFLIIVERIITKITQKILKTKKRQSAALDNILHGQVTDQYLTSELPVLSVESANKLECLTWLENINPDYIFIYGTGIIGRRVLSMPARQALNLHTGISPYYRGSSCAFWPLFNKEPHMVGSTVHKCTPDVDGGDIYGRTSVRLNETDDPYVAFAKSVKAGAVLYANVAKSLVEGEDIIPVKQDFSLGTEYRFKNKTFFHELAMEYRIRSGQLRKTIAASQKTNIPYPESGTR